MLVALFQNVRVVMAVDALCREHSVEVKIMPVPEQLSSECGMCLALNGENRAEMDELCRKNSIEVSYGEI